MNDHGLACNFELNTELNAEELNRLFARCYRVHVDNFLRPSIAEALYRHLVTYVPWRTLVVANEALMGTAPGGAMGLQDDEKVEISTVAYDGCRNGFASLYDADRVFPEDDRSDTSDASQTSPFLKHFSLSLETSSFFPLIRTITGNSDLSSIELQALRFRPGHFSGYHAALPPKDRGTKQRANCFFNLTPEWKPEWGGLLAFRSENGGVDAYVPCFNTFDLLAFPLGHWISYVPPFAGNCVVGIWGRIYSA